VQVTDPGAVQCRLWSVHDDGRDLVVFSCWAFDSGFRNFFQKIKADKN
jgi:hypothetical protein